MICVSLGNIPFDECTSILDSEELVEIRMDLLNYTDNEYLKLFSKNALSVATFRPIKEVSEKERLEKLKLAISFGANYIDIEYESNESYRQELMSFAKKSKCKIIVSYHNYNLTPEIKELTFITEKIFAMGADIAKLATMANSYKDNAKILSLYTNEKPVIAFCMGNTGVLSRVLALKFGAEFTFAALNEKQETAPGQLTKKQINNFIENIKSL